MDFLPTVLAAIAAFVATNIDDIFLLMIYFSQSNQGYTKRHIILGQYLGFGLLVLLSILGFVGALFIPKAWIGLFGLLPIFLGIHQLFSKKEEEEIQQIPVEENQKKGTIFTSILSPQTYAIALITFANGGDNLSIYIPLFASQSLIQLAITLTVFALLIALWLYLGYILGKHPVVMNVIKNYGHLIVPFVLIGLGIFIIIENDSLSIFWQFFSAQ